MKQIVSLCVFGKDEEFWKFTLPAIIINKIVYKDFIIRLYVSSMDINHVLISALRELSNNTFFELVIVDKPYLSLEVTIWRMLPLWDKDVDVFLCRDVDAYPTSMEVKSTYYFLNHSEYDIHGIRSCASHSGLYLMAGLCGFRKEKLKDLPGTSTYNVYEKLTYHISTGGDQEALKQCFYNSEGVKHLITLDTVLRTCLTTIFSPEVFNPSRVSIEEYDKVDISFVDSSGVLDWGKGIEYEGQHQYFSLDVFKKLLEFDCEISKVVKEIVNSNLGVKNYFGI